ncbi:MAG: putative acetyltransferase [Polyangiaceae bacterium]|jgi:sugar O-acyltransferase (sialic acid O-acetyltransferase NeuD family)|nr:putative acetyltransferase [Polyangiaceae bacterium]
MIASSLGAAGPGTTEVARHLVVVGAGGHGRVVAEAATAAGWKVLAFADQTLAGGELAGVPVLPGEVDDIARVAAREGAAIIVAIGTNATRRRLQLALQSAGVELAVVIHPTAVVLGGAQVGDGTVVLARAMIGVDCRVGRGAIVNSGVILEHDGHLGDFSHLSPGVVTGGEVRVGEGAHLGVGVSVRNRARIGEWSVVGVGAAVVTDLPDRIVAYGVPARVMRSIEG